MPAPQGLFLNEDCDHFVYSRSHDQLTPEGVDAMVDGYVRDTQVTDVLFNTNASRSAIPSRVKQTFWDGFDPELDDDQPYFANTKEGGEIISKVNRGFHVLQQRGIDLYDRWIRRTRQLGARPWISIRMNDIHNVNEAGHAMHDRLFREHPEFWRCPWREFEWPGDRALDYGHRAVADHHIAYAKECLERYDIDGLELDWMRQPWCFRPGREEEGQAISERVVAEVRAALAARAKELGHPIRLLVRVPSRPDAAPRFGFDAVRWARRGLVDVVVPSPDFGTTEYDMPVETWRQLLEGTGVELAPGLEATLNPFPFAPFQLHTLETAQGAAAGLLGRGAERIYLFNFMDYTGDNDPLGKDGLRTALKELGSLETLAGKPRRHVVTFVTPRVPGENYGGALPYRLGRFGYRPTPEFRIPIGPRPRTGEEALVRLGVESDAPAEGGTPIVAFGRQLRRGAAPADPAVARGLVVRIDGQACPFAGEVASQGKPIGPTHAYRIPAGALRRGDNVVEVSNYNDTFLTLVWVEIAIGKTVN